jgi:DNA-binding transcriptional LysR family regulator
LGDHAITRRYEHALVNEVQQLMRPDLPDLAAFAAVARHRSFRRAAIELGVSPSAVSHAIRGLEERLGVRLLNRTTRSVTPTEAGDRLLARLEPAFRDIAGAVEEINDFRQRPAGSLKLNDLQLKLEGSGCGLEALGSA